MTDEAFAFSRAKDKSNKELEAYKFYVNSLYVAFTRAVKNIYVIESNRKQPILELLDIKKTIEKVNLDKQQSDNSEWLEEAERLEPLDQGRGAAGQEGLRGGLFRLTAEGGTGGGSGVNALQSSSSLTPPPVISPVPVTDAVSACCVL